MAGDWPADFPDRAKGLVSEAVLKAEPIATRKASQNTLEVLVPALPELVGGSADLTGSNFTMVKASQAVGKAGGNYLFYGVREFVTAAVMHCLALLVRLHSLGGN